MKDTLDLYLDLEGIEGSLSYPADEILSGLLEGLTYTEIGLKVGMTRQGVYSRVIADIRPVFKEYLGEGFFRGLNHNPEPSPRPSRDHPLYYIWYGMRSRCNNPTYGPSYFYYGHQDIDVCTRWDDLRNFVEDMYPTYEPGLTLDRIDPTQDYCPENCRWVDWPTQANNRRDDAGLPREVLDWINKHNRKSRRKAARNYYLKKKRKDGSFSQPELF